MTGVGFGASTGVELGGSIGSATGILVASDPGTCADDGTPLTKVAALAAEDVDTDDATAAAAPKEANEASSPFTLDDDSDPPPPPAAAQSKTPLIARLETSFCPCACPCTVRSNCGDKWVIEAAADNGTTIAPVEAPGR